MLYLHAAAIHVSLAYPSFPIPHAPPCSQPVNSAVGLPFPSVLVSGKDGAGTIVFQIVSGNSNAAFSIDSCTGQVRVADPALIDFERLNPGSADTFSLGVRAFIAGSSPVAESFAKMDITVTDTK